MFSKYYWKSKLVGYQTKILNYAVSQQRQLKETQRKFCHKIQERQKKLAKLRETVKSHKVSFEQKNNCWLLKSCLRLSKDSPPSQVKSSHYYLYSAFNNANCVKAALHQLDIKLSGFVSALQYLDREIVCWENVILLCPDKIGSLNLGCSSQVPVVLSRWLSRSQGIHWGSVSGAHIIQLNKVLSVPLKPTVGNRLWGSSKSWVNGLILMLLSLCVLTALCTGSSGGQWEDLYWDYTLHWEKPLWGDTADQRSGKGWSESSWRTTEATGAGDWRSEEEKRWAGAAFTHRPSHPFPPGNRDLMNRTVVFKKGRACCTEIVFLSNVCVFSWYFSCVFVSV